MAILSLRSASFQIVDQSFCHYSGKRIRSRMASLALRYLESLAFPVFQREFGDLVGAQPVGHKKEQDRIVSPTSDCPSVHRFQSATEWSGEILSAEEGSLYPALHRMEEAGWICAKWVIKENGKRARIYQMTAAGAKHLTAEEMRWKTVSSAINRVLREA